MKQNGLGRMSNDECEAGYVRRDDSWVKAVVVSRRGLKLGVRVAPQLTEKIVHADDFLTEAKVRLLNQGSMPQPAPKAWLETLKSGQVYLRRALRFKKNNKISESQTEDFYRGLVGWTRITIKRFLISRKKWTRCMIMKPQDNGLVVCISPNLEFIEIDQKDFVVERSIEHGLKKLSWKKRLALKAVLRANRISYKVNPQFSVHYQENK